MTTTIGTIPGAFKITASDKDSHFTGALATNAAEEENISFHTDWATAGIQVAEVTNISLESDQQLDWELQFYATDGQADTSDMDNDTFITSVLFSSSDAKQNAATGQWKYDANPTFLPFNYIDQDNSSEWHVTLVNRDGVSKNSGNTGEVVIKIHAVPVI